MTREYPTAITGTWTDLERLAWYVYENDAETTQLRALAEAVLVLLESDRAARLHRLESTPKT